MILLLHIIVASASLIYTGYLFMRPSKQKLRVAYTLVALTLISGFTLVLTKPAAMAQSCVMGVAYLAFVSYGIISARHKLAGQQL